MPFLVLDYTQFMFVNNEHNEIAVVVTCIANSSLSSHAHASHQSHASKKQESRDDQHEYTLRTETTITPAPYSLFSAAPNTRATRYHQSKTLRRTSHAVWAKRES